MGERARERKRRERGEVRERKERREEGGKTGRRRQFVYPYIKINLYLRNNTQTLFAVTDK